MANAELSRREPAQRVSGRLERLVGRGLVPSGGFGLPSFLVRNLRLLYETLGARAATP